MTHTIGYRRNIASGYLISFLCKHGYVININNTLIICCFISVITKSTFLNESYAEYLQYQRLIASTEPFPKTTLCQLPWRRNRYSIQKFVNVIMQTDTETLIQSDIQSRYTTVTIKSINYYYKLPQRVMNSTSDVYSLRVLRLYLLAI